MNVLEKIFSIKNFGETHKIMYLFGIKIKFPKREFIQKKKQNPYYFYKKNNIDITTLPKATGQIRDIQLANLELLKELDYVCKQNNLTYWLDFGTLLGAIRHKGFIPWDDDIDVGMLRNDYEKIIEAFEKSSRNPDIYASFVVSKTNACQYYIKVQHKACQYLFVDIFPYDFYGEILPQNDRLNMTTKIRKLRKKMQAICENKKNEENIKNTIANARNEILKINNIENSDLIWGIDFNHLWKKWIYSYETIFPLSQIQFENLTFPCPNKKEEFMQDVYGNYMDYPKKISFGHSMFLNLTQEKKDFIKEFIGENK